MILLQQNPKSATVLQQIKSVIMTSQKERGGHINPKRRKNIKIPVAKIRVG
ncbi:MAG: hypothetical protein LUI12_10965 [Clostridiales bacterium]|nr:hypothetical protein [Clostridiales bacterium]